MAQTLAPTFGDLLKHVRKRAGMTQGDLAAAVGYSVSFVSVLEQNRRLPDVDAVLQVFVPALGLLDEPHLATRLVALAASARGERPPVAITRQREMQIVVTEVRGERAAHLPTAPTDLIGRDHDVRQLCQRLPGHTGRLLTLVGPPGIGKTQLALAVAHQLHYHYPDGAAFVALAAVSDAVSMATTIAASVGCSDASPKPPKTKLIAWLRNKTMLVVLDNLEQIRDGAPLIAELLAECPGVCILATSRERLHLRAEQRFQVPPLDLVPAIELFVQRAQAVNADFRLTPENQPILAAICQRLDCLPLALELCAAQIDLLAPAQLLAHLHDRRLDLLMEGAHDLPPRQRTLRAAIQHSYQLLDEAERTLFRYLGIFVGGFDLQAMAAVAADSTATAARPLNATLHTLIGKSLVRAETTPSGELRFSLLETLREYARERLEAHGETATVRQYHVAYYLTLAEADDFGGPQLASILDLVATEYDNMRAAAAWFEAADDDDSGLRLAAALWGFWAKRGHFTEGRAWLDRTLAGGSAAATPTRASALFGAGVLAHMHGDQERAAPLLEASLAMYRAVGDYAGMGWSLYILSAIATLRGDHVQQRALQEESAALFHAHGSLEGRAAASRALGDYEASLALYRELGDTSGISQALELWGHAQYTHGNNRQAMTLIEEALELARELGDRWAIMETVTTLGGIVCTQGEYERAEQLFHEGLAISRTLHDWRGSAEALTGLGKIAQRQGDHIRAGSLFTANLKLFHQYGHQPGILACIRGLAFVAYDDGQAVRAAQLLGIIAHLCAADPPPPLPLAEAARYDVLVQAVEGQLDQATFAIAIAAGQSMTLDEAFTTILAPIHPISVPTKVYD